MRVSAQRSLAFAFLALVAVPSGRALAQAEQPEEITVRGQKTLEQYRVELEQAREDLVTAYNEANSSDDNDITCRNERVTGTRMPQRICRSNAQTQAEANASRDFLRALTHSSGRYATPLGQPPEGAIPQVNASIGAAVAQSEEAGLTAESRAIIEAELERLKKEDRRVYRAVVRYLELQDEYDRARGATAAQ